MGTEIEKPGVGTSFVRGVGFSFGVLFATTLAALVVSSVKKGNTR